MNNIRVSSRVVLGELEKHIRGLSKEVNRGVITYDEAMETASELYGLYQMLCDDVCIPAFKLEQPDQPEWEQL